MSRELVLREKRNRKILQRRKAYIRKQRLCFLIAILFVTVFTTGILVKNAYAGDYEHANASSMTKVYTSIQIHSGDTLTSIGSKYLCKDMDNLDHFIYEIQSINHLNDDSNLIAGNYLIIPSYKSIN